MEIKKILRIESPVHLYRLVDQDRSVYESFDDDVAASRISLLCDAVAEYLYGCKCEEDANWALVEREYRELIGDSSVLARLRSFYGCDSVEFIEGY